MKYEISFHVKSYVLGWSNQIINTTYKNVSIHIQIDGMECHMILDGDENVAETFYLIWELLFLYDGYFYKLKCLKINGEEQDADSLMRVCFYATDSQWMSSPLLGRNARELSAEIIEKYDVLRNTGIAEKKMTKSVVNAFYYLHSEAYKGINSNHRLSLLLNVADGLIINTYKDTNNVKASLDKLFKETIDSERVRKGIKLMGLPDEQYRFYLAEERNAFDHYSYKENSIASLIAKSADSKTNYATWYFIYVMELVIRLYFLKEIGVEIAQDIRNYAMDEIVDWIIYENNLEEECATPWYQMRQLERRLEERAQISGGNSE